ncbi:MAG: AzlC family ABC transporter permease [Acidimicrobiales bacterium]
MSAPAPNVPPPIRWVDLVTLGFTYFAVGVTVSVALVERGTPTLNILGAAVIVYSATSELAYIAVRDGGGGVVAGVLSGWLVASRFGLLCVSLGAKLTGDRGERTVAALLAVDPSVALAAQQSDPVRVRQVYRRASVVLMSGWLAGNLVGVGVGNVVSDANRWGLDAVFPAALLAIIGNRLRSGDGLTAALVGAGLCLLLVPVAPGGVPILASVLGAGAGLAVARRRGA